MGCLKITFYNEKVRDTTYREIFIDSLGKLLEDKKDLLGDLRITIPIYSDCKTENHITHIIDGNKEQLEKCKRVLITSNDDAVKAKVKNMNNRRTTTHHHLQDNESKFYKKQTKFYKTGKKLDLN